MTDLAAPEGLPPLAHYWTGIQKALRHGAEVYTLDQLTEGVQSGRFQFWPISETSVMLTQISGETLHFFIAFGKMPEIQAATPHILDFGRDQGCTKATLIGRRGWSRSWLADDGWAVDPIISMSREL